MWHPWQRKRPLMLCNYVFEVELYVQQYVHADERLQDAIERAIALSD